MMSQISQFRMYSCSVYHCLWNIWFVSQGDSRTFESALLYNHGDENREGGNVLLTLADCDSSGSSKSISLHIWSTYFLHGDSPQLDFPTGLTVKILGSNLCTNTYLVLDNVTVSHNNLGITLSYQIGQVPTQLVNAPTLHSFRTSLCVFTCN